MACGEKELETEVSCSNILSHGKEVGKTGAKSSGGKLFRQLYLQNEKTDVI